MLVNSDPKYTMAVVLDTAIAEIIEYAVGSKVYSTIVRMPKTIAQNRITM